MVGLGDIVLPGIMIGLALRFDLYLHYLRLQTFSRSRTEGGITKTEARKALWRPVSGRWADMFWIHAAKHVKGVQKPSTHFAKPYFYASLAGYIVGLITTIIAMHVSGHGQPALLYLVPGVLGSLILTALWRNETKAMWEFSEAVEEEEEVDKIHKTKEAAAKLDEPNRTGLFSKLLGGSSISPPEKKVLERSTETNKESSVALRHARESRSESFSSSWGSATSSEPSSPLPNEARSFKPAPVRSPLMLRSAKADSSVHSDANTFFSITLSLPSSSKETQPKNWKETAMGDEVLAPSGKRQRTSL
jgi:minor histocompatibility antigen H13